MTDSLPRRPLASWLHEGARVLDVTKGVEAVVQFVGAWEDPATRKVIDPAVFLRPEGGGVEWVVLPDAVRPAGTR